MKRIIASIKIMIIVVIVLVFCEGQSNAAQQQEKAKVIDENPVVVNGRAFSVDEIIDGIKAVFNSDMYYFGLDWYEPFFQKDVEYDLYYAQRVGVASAPEKAIHMIITNVLHDLSSENEFLYQVVGINITEYGLLDGFYYRSYGSWEDMVLTRHEGENYLGHYIMRIDEVIPPQYEPKDAEWQESTIKVIQEYMDQTLLDYADEDYALKPGNYHVYMRNFPRGETYSLVVFEHQNGDVYWGQYCHLNYTSNEYAPYISHVSRIDWENLDESAGWEQEDAEMLRGYIEKIKLDPAISFEYAVKPWIIQDVVE